MKLFSNSIIDGWLNDDFGNNTKNKSDIINGINKKSFHLAWDNIPSDTKSICLIFDDYDAVPVCGFVWIHWLVADIDINLKELPIDASRTMCDQLIQGKTSWSSPLLGDSKVINSNAYGGCAPPNCDHEYRVTLYALSEKTNLKNGFTYNELIKKINKSLIDKAELHFMYKKI